jgi:predicted nucleic acid-binding protein
MSGSVVVDASVVAKWVLDEPYSEEAVALLRAWISQEMRLLAPAWMTTEVTSILYKRMRKGDITIEAARASLASLLLTDITFDYDSTLSVRALDLAYQHGLSAPYDAHYLALAEREACELWTADERLWNAVKGKLAWVRWIGDYRPSADQQN